MYLGMNQTHFAQHSVFICSHLIPVAAQLQLLSHVLSSFGLVDGPHPSTHRRLAFDLTSQLIPLTPVYNINIVSKVRAVVIKYDHTCSYCSIIHLSSTLPSLSVNRGCSWPCSVLRWRSSTLARSLCSPFSSASVLS